MRKLFVTGMFRSGTTLVARMLNTHPDIAFASDPYLEILKSFVASVVEEEIPENKFDIQAPLDDYYFYSEKQEIMNAVQQASLEFSVSDLDFNRLRERVSEAAAPYSPKIVPFLDELSGTTFGKLLESGLEIINKAYGDSNSEQVGFKSVWAGEFTTHFLDYFDNSRVVHIVRDPRAVCASKFAREDKYPFLFLSRQWRKLASFAWRDDNKSEISENVLLLRYEDLITEPQETIKNICDFLKVRTPEILFDPGNYLDGEGNPWRQNSAHFNGGQKFNQESVDKWKKVLSAEQAEYIEALCGPEMRLLGYKLTELGAEKFPADFVFSPPEVDNASVAEWLKPHVALEPEPRCRELALEYYRKTQLADDKKLSEDLCSKLFLFSSFYEALWELQNSE